MKALFFPDDPQFEYETVRALGHAAYAGAELGEVLAVVAAIEPGDYDGWYAAWAAMADRVNDQAHQALRAGNRSTARDGWLRASNYYRNAGFFLHVDPADPRIAAAYTSSVAAFRAAGELFDPPITPVEIPYAATVLHGYAYRSSHDGPRPVIIMHNGFDGSVEEMHFFGAQAAAERGFDVVTFDGPGQPAALHHDGLAFRPDWERVVTPVVDWVLEQPRTDANKVALLGLSMGGYLAPRAAAYEHRLKACIAVDGVYDMGIVATSDFPMSRTEAEAALRAEDGGELDAFLAAVAEQDPKARWALAHGCYAMGVATPREFLAAYSDYTLAGVAERIECPTLVCEAESDMFFPGQPEMLFEHLNCPKTLMGFTDAQGAGLHCHVGAQRLAFGRILDWLKEVMP